MKNAKKRGYIVENFEEETSTERITKFKITQSYSLYIMIVFIYIIQIFPIILCVSFYFLYITKENIGFDLISIYFYISFIINPIIQILYIIYGKYITDKCKLHDKYTNLLLYAPVAIYIIIVITARLLVTKNDKGYDKTYEKCCELHIEDKNVFLNINQCDFFDKSIYCSDIPGTRSEFDDYCFLQIADYGYIYFYVSILFAFFYIFYTHSKILIREIIEDEKNNEINSKKELLTNEII